jgi:cytochrome P450
VDPLKSTVWSDFPKDSVFMFDQFSVGVDPSVVEEPERLTPERRFSDAVEARKGTPMEMLDHPFCSDLFSQGARRCPGSRVAVNETLTFLAHSSTIGRLNLLRKA